MSGERLRILSRAEIPDWAGALLDEETERVARAFGAMDPE